MGAGGGVEYFSPDLEVWVGGGNGEQPGLIYMHWGTGQALTPLCGHGPGEAEFGGAALPPFLCCQIFQPMGIPVGWVSWLYRPDLAYGPEV